MKKFLSHSLSGVAVGVGVPLGEGDVATAGTVVVVAVAGDMVVVAGDIPETGAVAPGAAGAAGVVTGAVTGAVAGAVTGAVAGLVAVVGGAPGGFAGVVGGGWPNEVSARVTEKRLAISSVFIG